jgi:hypothetical protein
MKEGTHDNAPLAYHSIDGLQEIARKKQRTIKVLRLKRLNDVRMLGYRSRVIEEHKMWILAIGSGKVERVERLVQIGLRRRLSIRAMLGMYDRAARKVYRPRNYSEIDDMRALLLWRLGGERLANIGHRALGLPAVNTLRQKTLIAPLVVSAGQPTVKEIAQNVKASFEPIQGMLKEKKVVHQIAMLDEIKIEERTRYCQRTNTIHGLCREHGSKCGYRFNSKEDVMLLLDSIQEGKVHLAVEVRNDIYFYSKFSLCARPQLARLVF